MDMGTVSLADIEDSDWTGRRKPKPQLETKPFIAWDGEGINLMGEGRPQSYVLFGCTEGHIASQEGLSIWQCLEFIIDIGRRFPQRIPHRICVLIRRQHDNPASSTKYTGSTAPEWMGETTAQQRHIYNQICKRQMVLCFMASAKLR